MPMHCRCRRYCALHYVAESLGVPITRIGRIMEGQGVHTEGHDGPSGYERVRALRLSAAGICVLPVRGCGQGALVAGHAGSTGDEHLGILRIRRCALRLTTIFIAGRLTRRHTSRS
jgi:hypothetical protein